MRQTHSSSASTRFAIFSFGLALMVCYGCWGPPPGQTPSERRDSPPATIDRRARSTLLLEEISRPPDEIGTQAPVPPQPPELRPALPAPADAVAQIRNSDLVWVIARMNDGTFRHWFTPSVTAGGAAYRLLEGHQVVDEYAKGANLRRPLYERAELRQPLLTALNDPDRFAAAHVLLSLIFPEKRRDPGGPLVSQPNGTFHYVFDGLAVTLRPLGPAEEGTTYEGVAAFQPCSAHVDRAQLPLIREQWQRRFIREVPEGAQ